MLWEQFAQNCFR